MLCLACVCLLVSKDNLKGLSALLNLLHILIVSCLTNAFSRAGFASKTFSQDVADVVQLSVSFLPEVEEVAESEVTECHEIANGLHDVPTGDVKGANEDEHELRHGH